MPPLPVVEFGRVLHESRVEAKGLGKFTASLRNVKRAAPPTRLVYYEDLVATTGGLLAMIAVLVTALTNFNLLDGVSSILISFMMIGVAFRVGYDNMVGLIGVAAPPEIEERISRIIFDEPLADPHISDVTLGILEDNGVRNWVPQHELN